MLKIISLFLISILMVSCGLSTKFREINLSGDYYKAQEVTKYGEHTVHKLFTTKEGVTVFRFIDGGHARYFAIKGENLEEISSYQDSGGKNKTYSENKVIVGK